MPHPFHCRLHRRSVLAGLAKAALLTLASASAIRAESPPMANEEILSMRRVNPRPAERAWVTSRLTVPIGGRWEVDPAEGPLTLAVHAGELIVSLGGGAARIERRFDLFLQPEVGPLEENVPATLQPDDKLVIVRGYHLTVTNDGVEPATAIVSRMVSLAGEE